MGFLKDMAERYGNYSEPLLSKSTFFHSRLPWNPNYDVEIYFCVEKKNTKRILETERCKKKKFLKKKKV